MCVGVCGGEREREMGGGEEGGDEGAVRCKAEELALKSNCAMPLDDALNVVTLALISFDFFFVGVRIPTLISCSVLFSPLSLLDVMLPVLIMLFPLLALFFSSSLLSVVISFSLDGFFKDGSWTSRILNSSPGGLIEKESERMKSTGSIIKYVLSIRNIWDITEERSAVFVRTSEECSALGISVENIGFFIEEEEDENEDEEEEEEEDEEEEEEGAVPVCSKTEAEGVSRETGNRGEDR